MSDTKRKYKRYMKTDKGTELHLDVLVLSVHCKSVDTLVQSILKKIASPVKWNYFFKLLLLLNKLLVEDEINRGVVQDILQKMRVKCKGDDKF